MCSGARLPSHARSTFMRRSPCCTYARLCSHTVLCAARHIVHHTARHEVSTQHSTAQPSPPASRLSRAPSEPAAASPTQGTDSTPAWHRAPRSKAWSGILHRALPGAVHTRAAGCTSASRGSTTAKHSQLRGSLLFGTVVQSTYRTRRTCMYSAPCTPQWVVQWTTRHFPRIPQATTQCRRTVWKRAGSISSASSRRSSRQHDCTCACAVQHDMHMHSARLPIAACERSACALRYVACAA